MNEIKKTALWFALLGFVVGVAVGVMFYLPARPDGFLAHEENRHALLLYFLFSGLYGGLNMGSSALYSIENWSILRCTLTHLAICVGSTIVFFCGMILLGWMSVPSAPVCALAGAAFVFVYAMIWLGQYLAYRRQVKKMNAKLRAWKGQRK
ncbi:MAG: DUF3021 domain-containing protein [Clostridia bacterium]|nr:DUF3021 domain-containing protein [Clostridia bacterium]